MTCGRAAKRAAACVLVPALLALCGCPGPPRQIIRPPPLGAGPGPGPGPDRVGADREASGDPAIAGVIHMVKPGQTLYRIARAYGISPADLMETNGITDPRSLEVGQELFVPGATAALDVDAVAAAGFKTAARPAGDRASPGPASPPSLPARLERRPAPPPEPDEPSPPQDAVAGSARHAALAWPLRGVLYGRFGVRGGARHDGIDIAAPEGTPISAAADGIAIYVGEQSGYGQVVILRHEDGLVTVYAHASAVLVREGARVVRGQPVARVGQTGRTTGPHLHFEVREGTRPKNPLLYLP